MWPGIAYALAPNYNKPIVGFIFSREAQQAAVTQARAAIASAQASLATREHSACWCSCWFEAVRGREYSTCCIRLRACVRALVGILIVGVTVVCV